MNRSIMGGFTILLAPPLLPVESVVQHFQQCNTDREPSVEFWIASPEKPNRFETDKSALGTAIRRLQRKGVLRWLLQDRASQPVLFPCIEALAKKRPLLGRTSEPVGDFRSRNLIHTPSLHLPQWIHVLALISASPEHTDFQSGVSRSRFIGHGLRIFLSLLRHRMVASG